QNALWPPGGHVPQAHRVVSCPTGQHLPVRTKTHCGDCHHVTKNSNLRQRRNTLTLSYQHWLSSSATDPLLTVSWRDPKQPYEHHAQHAYRGRMLSHVYFSRSNASLMSCRMALQRSCTRRRSYSRSSPV